MTAQGESGPRPILVVDVQDDFHKTAAKVLSEHKVFEARNVSEAQAIVADETIHLVFVGPSFGHEVGVAECSLLLDIQPRLAMVLVTDGLDAPTLKSALRAGFRDAIEAPLALSKVEEVLRPIDQVEARLGDVEESEARPRPGKVVTIMSPKGGAGKTVAATNVALLLALWSEPGRIALFDADLQFGDVSLCLQLDPESSIVDAAMGLEELDEATLDSLLVRHESGLRVLPAPLEPALADEISTQAVVKILGMLRRMFDFVVIDTAPFLDEPVLTVLERSDAVLLVAEGDVPSVKNAKLALDTLRLINFPMEKIHLVLNRVDPKARFEVEELERSLELRVMAAIPSDKIVPRSVNEGVPVVALSPRSRVARGFHDVARLVANGQAPMPEERGRRWFG